MVVQEIIVEKETYITDDTQVQELGEKIINIGFFEIPHFFVQGGSTDQLLNMWGQTPHMR